MKNHFLIANDIIYDLYSCGSCGELKDKFLSRLNLLIPCQYASFLIKDKTKPSLEFLPPICFPDEFEKAEQKYLEVSELDNFLWILHSRESQLIRESELSSEQQRLSSAVYKNCYSAFDIYDSLQYSSVYNQNFLGVLTLFRTKNQGEFNQDDMFYMRIIGNHLNAVLDKIINGNAQRFKNKANEMFTNKENEILSYILELKTNEEIMHSLNISNNTLQKHMQHIFQKLNVTSKWELLRFFKN